MIPSDRSSFPSQINRALALEAGIVGIGHLPFIDHDPAAKAAVLEQFQRLRAIHMAVAARQVLGRATVTQRAVRVSELHVADVLHADPL